MIYRPEGCLFRTAENQKYISSPEGLHEAMERGVILEARAALCDSSHDLHVELPCASGIIRREDGALGIAEGVTRDIALISRVNKIVCFKIRSLDTDENGRLCAMLSRADAQAECMSRYSDTLSPGDIIEARVTHLEQFGAFVDIGCGLPSLVPIDAISVSRIAHPSDRFAVGDFIKAVVKSRDGHRICLSHKELLGSWEENAARFSEGETVAGVVRSVENYGIFVELAPNLAGLAELRGDVLPGQSVSVYIKSIIPEKMKIKLIIIDVSTDCAPEREIVYYYKDDHMTRWNYAPECSGRKIETVF